MIFLYLRSWLGVSELVRELLGDVLVLQAAQPLVFAGDLVERLHHLRLQLGFDRGERQGILHVVIVQVAFAGRGRALLAFGRAAAVLAGRLVALLRRAVAGRAERGRRRRRGRGRGHHRGAAHDAGVRRTCRHRGRARSRRAGNPRLTGHAGVRHALHGIRPGVGRLQVDDVAQEHFSFVEFVAPDDDRLEGQRALAQARDHRLAAGLDALGDRDFALAREQFDRAHFAQIHAHRVVGALARLRLLGFGDGFLRDLDEVAARLIVVVVVLAFFLAGFLGLDDVDAHLVEHREHVLDLLRSHFLGGKDAVELLVGHIAALLGILDHLPDGGIRKVEQRAVGALRRVLVGGRRRRNGALGGGLDGDRLDRLDIAHGRLARCGLGGGGFDRGADAGLATGFGDTTLAEAAFAAGLAAGFFTGAGLAFDFAAVLDAVADFDAITVLCAAPADGG